VRKAADEEEAEVGGTELPSFVGDVAGLPRQVFINDQELSNQKWNFIS
jgi:hypothetical protein